MPCRCSTSIVQGQKHCLRWRLCCYEVKIGVGGGGNGNCLIISVIEHWQLKPRTLGWILFFPSSLLLNIKLWLILTSKVSCSLIPRPSFQNHQRNAWVWVSVKSSPGTRIAVRSSNQLSVIPHYKPGNIASTIIEVHVHKPINFEISIWVQTYEDNREKRLVNNN